MIKILLGPTAFDAAKYVRSKIEDLTGVEVEDDVLGSYVETANENFSKHVPRNFVVGNPALNSSPLQTVAQQQRYLCSPANGFAVAPFQITDVLYLSAAPFSAAYDMSYLYMLPFSPLNRFFGADANPMDTPSTRVINEGYLQEVEKYGKGSFGVVLDGSGFYAIDLYPIPLMAGLPIFVRYDSIHLVTTADNGDITIATIPQWRVRDWSTMLLLEVLDQRALRMMRQKAFRAGLVMEQEDSKSVLQQMDAMREELYHSLGAHVGVGLASTG